VALEPKIDDLYKGPLGEFVAARAALAKTLTGDDAKRIKRLQKPTVVPWAVNQVYWHARPVYDRLASSGEKLRTAQIEALKGRSTDVRRATEAHRKAIAEASAEALRLASAIGARPNANELTKTLEAVSLAPDLPEQPGRLTKTLQPAGFEALAGVPLKARPRATVAAVVPPARPMPAAAVKPDRTARQREAAERRRRHTIAQAEQVVARARAAEARARAAWERTKQALAAAESKLSKL
jgi:hypothetical protein